MAGDNHIMFPKKYHLGKSISGFCNQMLIPFTVLLIFSSLMHLGVNGAPSATVSDEDSPTEDNKSYGIIIDAGSSGSRIRIYAWTPSDNSGKLPDFAQIHSKKINPGISNFASNTGGLQDYITPLLEDAKETIPDAKHARTPLYLMATAGMRLLLEDHASDVLEELDTIFKDTSLSPFVYYSQNARILSGEEEGAFAWIAVNYLRGYFDPGSGVEKAGILELGGASTQIAFLPDGQILDNLFPVRIAGKIHNLYVHSYLYYGGDYVRKRIMEKLYEQNKEEFVVDNPCLLKGDGQRDHFDGLQVLYRGTGQPEECLKMMKFIYKADEDFCYPKPCAIGTVYQPKISDTHVFYAVGSFIHSPKNFGVADNFSPQAVREAAIDICGGTLDEALVVAPESKPKFISDECTIGLYMAELFTRGYGFANDTEQIKVQKQIHERNPDWPLGAIIYETERMQCVTGAAVSTHTFTAKLSFITAILTVSYYLGYSILNS